MMKKLAESIKLYRETFMSLRVVINEESYSQFTAMMNGNRDIYLNACFKYL